MASPKIVLILLLASNVLSYVVMWVDKYRAKRGSRRVPEILLWLQALLFGAFGIFLGMKFPLYHKAAKPLFRLGIPVFVLLNLLFIVLWWPDY